MAVCQACPVDQEEDSPIVWGILRATAIIWICTKILLKENAINKNLRAVIGMMVALGVISAVLTYIRTEKMSAPADLATKGLAAAQRANVIFFGVFIPVLVYRAMLVRSPDTVQTSFLLLAMAIAVFFTIMAAVVFKMRGFAEFTMLHVLYAAGFGWLLPMLWAR